ncbi:MAG: hypothetical protein E7513_07235 [Ruminococcaceae bacterium]|nr:hypothetical protein [Oscillospiraceae bacterium]
MKKRVFYTELSYIIGLISLALSAALMEKADFGVSMVVAPAYLLHLKVSQFLPFFSFGMAEYTLQAVLLIIMVIALRKFKVSYLFSFVTAVLYGFILDFMMLIVAYIPSETLIIRTMLYVLGLLGCAVGVSLLFHTYISPEVYELFVKEVSSMLGININRFKTIYDCSSCLIAIVMSFSFFGMWQFEGVKLGTIICALINGFTIGAFSKLFEKLFEFKDRLQLRRFFE